MSSTTDSNQQTKRNRGSVIFNRKWLLECAIAITATDSYNRPTTVVCRFCQHFGKEKKDENRKRKVSQNIQMYMKPWRSDKMKEHNMRMHCERWSEYQSLSLRGKKYYFDDHSPASKNSILSMFPREVDKCTMTFDRNVIEILIGTLFIDDDDESDILQSSKIFKLSNEFGEALDSTESSNDSFYTAEISNKYQYDHVMAIIGCGLSFRQTDSVIQACKEISMDSKLGFINRTKISQMVRLQCAISLQVIKRALEKVWSFSIALDAGNKSNTSYLDIRIRFVLHGAIYNIHLIAIPMFESHTGLYMYQLFEKVFDVLCCNWREKIIGYTSDGASSMTGSVKGVGTRIGQVALPGFFRIWCGAHQLDLVVQAVLKSMYNEAFVKTIQSLTGYLRRQQNLIRAMRCKCPRFIDTRWLSMGRLLTWLKSKRRHIINHLEEKNPECRPSLDWWIIVYAMQKVIEICNKYMTELQGKQLLVSQQKTILNRLMTRLKDLGQVNSTFPVTNVAPSDFVSEGLFVMTVASAKSYILNLGDLYIIEVYQQLEVENEARFKEITKSVANMFVKLIYGISILSPERDSQNNATSDLPPCQPYSIATLSAFEFSGLVKSQSERLTSSYPESYMDELMEEFKSFEDKFKYDAGFKATVDLTNNRTATFENNWKIFNSSFPKLVEFCGGLASVFAGTSTVESDFSIIGFEKDDYRHNLTDLSLEGILHTKQKKIIEQIDKVLDQLES